MYEFEKSICKEMFNFYYIYYIITLISRLMPHTNHVFHDLFYMCVWFLSVIVNMFFLTCNITFTKILQTQKDENWGLPIMYTLCLDLRKLATKVNFLMNLLLDLRLNV